MRFVSKVQAILLAVSLAAVPLTALAAARPVTEREKFEAEQAHRDRQLTQAERELELRREEQRWSRWSSPLVLAIIAATVAAFANIWVAYSNGKHQRELERNRANDNRELERQKAADQVELERSKAAAQRELDAQQAESARILEATKTAGSREAAAENLKFLLQAGLVTGALAERLRIWLDARQPGEGPSLPSADGRFQFEAGADLPSGLQVDIQKALDRFAAWLDGIGFPRSGAQVRIGTVDHENAFYDPATRSVMLGPSFREPSIACREYLHHVLLDEAPRQVFGVAQMMGIECGLADYFTCSFFDRPYVGAGLGPKLGLDQDHLRALTSAKGFAELGSGAGENVIFSDGEIWGSLSWAIRTAAGAAAADPLLRQAWTGTRWPRAHKRIVPAFLAALVRAAEDQGPGPSAAVQGVLEARGFPTSPPEANADGAGKAGSRRRRGK